MKNSKRTIELDFKSDNMSVRSCNFNNHNEIILFCTTKNFSGDYINIVCVYSIPKKNTQTKITKTKCQKIYELPKGAEVLSISKYEKIWLRLNYYIYEWDLLTGNTKILRNIYEVIVNFKILLNLLAIQTNLKINQQTKTKDIRISYNKGYTCLKINNQIIVHSNELDFPIASLDLNIGTYCCFILINFV